MGSDGGDDSWGDDEDNSVSIEGFATTASGHNNAELEEAINFNAAGPLASDTGLDQSHSTRLTLDYITKDTRSGSDEFRTSDETFTNLFEQGCKEYYDKNLDGAYLLWNDALAIAVEKKNREYIAIITHNLQRISYELLVKEGNALLEKGQLEEAGQAFELALDVGRKAHNAAWVTEMQNSRKEVQTAVFHRSHAAALAIFEKAKHMTNQTVNEDDYFIIPGTDTMVSHTEAFVNQWSRILLIQEAIYMWNDSATMAEHIGGAAGLSLRNDLINESLNAVSLYLVRLFFETENPNHLSMQRSSLYHYHEAVMLSELWTDMLQCMHGQLQHQLFCAVAAAQLGNLYLVTNQLQLAEQQFDQLVRYGRDNKDTLMEATGLTFSAVLNWQRANYAVAERQLETTLGKWELVRKEVDALRGVAREEGEEATNARKETIKERLRRAIPQDYVRVMANLCNSYKVSLYVNTYRYREGWRPWRRGWIYQYSDHLLEKMMMNYTAHPSVDQIVAVSKDVGTPLIYYFLAYRYDWSNEENVFVRSESVLIWFVPLSSEIRFVEMNVSKEFNTTVTDLILKFRNGLCIDPLGTSEVSPSTDIITSLHRNAWMDPLQLLYLIFIDPIFDNLKSLFYNAPEKLVDSVVTIIPTVQLWTLPFNAFLNPRKEHCYLIEEVAVQLAFSATQCAFNSILARRCRDYGLRKDLVVVQPEVNAPVTHVRLRFPMDSHRSVEEGEAIEQVFNTSKELLLATANTNSSVLTNSCVVVKDVDSLRTALPQSHYVHIATDTTSHADRKSSNDECRGAVCVFSSFGEGLLWSSEVQHMELTAELVTLSNTNIVLDNLNCVHDDVLGLMRSFFSGGVPCVIAGQWCTPDVVPAHLFVKLYSLLERPLETIQNSTKMTTSSVKMSSARPSTDGSVGGFGATHKALVLAKAIRELMNEEDTMRFSPRGWAAYYCVGCGST
ncbi:TPRcontaining protein [Angomonas deanei]|uniref:CHAT domain containing protein, putative n=1 Tax=Angomonas deanei TaxID=59799 RepID=A0A7G2CM19_9TRYP|nr:TPRcontaining protein [Angomonas deanei]CAD2220890.1 CHAT domain containing protein, putative [Angomonas deanei]|eukprot:EPY31130.1 TPRcontaining protein [Angomonas deanei]